MSVREQTGDSQEDQEIQCLLFDPSLPENLDVPGLLYPPFVHLCLGLQKGLVHHWILVYTNNKESGL